MATYSFAGVMALWTAAGGNPGWAPLAAAIAMSESGGDAGVLNDNPATGDYSVGLWQINYYNGLLASRTAAYGSPAALQADPALQAAAAVSLSNNGGNWGPWRSDRAWNAWQAAGAPSMPTEATISTWGVSMGGAGIDTASGSATPAISSPITGATAQTVTGGVGGALAAMAGFGVDLQPSDFVINGKAFTADFADAISAATIKRTNQTASTVSVTVSDPTRTLLRANIGAVGSTLNVEGLSFTLVQQSKASDQLQYLFEASGVASLRLLQGPTTSADSTDLTGFVSNLVSQVPGLTLVAETDPLAAAVSMGVGTSTDNAEDYWTAIQRVTTSGGWRCFEVNNVIYLGSDAWFLNGPTIATISEFTQGVQTIDYDYDVGKPFGTLTITGMCGSWGAPPGSVIYTQGMGPIDGQPFLVQDCSRNAFLPQFTVTAYAPMPPYNVINGTPGDNEAPF